MALGARRAVVGGLLGLLVACSVLLPGRAVEAAPGAEPTGSTAVPYGSDPDGPLLLDVYEPAGSGTDRPAVVLVHGGGWTSGDRTQVGPDAEALAAAGFVAFSIDYDENGPNRWRDELVDVQTAVRWVQANAGTYGVDPARIGLFGSSAGGNLVMLVATQGLGADGAPPVRAVASWSGPSDLSTLVSLDISPTDLTGAPGSVPGADEPVGCAGDPVCIGVIDPQAIQAYLGCTFTECPDTYADASPAGQATSSTPPMLLAAYEEDLVPVEQAYEMANGLNEAGVSSELLVLPGEGHAESMRAVALPPTVAFFTRFLVDGASPGVPPRSTPTTIAGSQPLPALADGWRRPAPAPPSTGRSPVGAIVGLAVLVVLIAGATAMVVRARRAS